MDEEIKFRMGLDTTPMARALRGAEATMKDFGAKARNAMSSVGQHIKKSFLDIGPAIAGAFTLGAMKNAIVSIQQYGAHIQDLQETTGATTDFIQGFGAAVAQNGGSAELAEKSLERLYVRIGQARGGIKEATDAFEQYGVSLVDMNGKAKSTDQIVFDIADRMKEAKDAGTEAAIAFEFFGSKLAAKLIPSLVKGGDELRRMTNEMEKLSAAEIEQMDAFGDWWDEKIRQMKVWGGRAITGGWENTSVGNVQAEMRSQLENERYAQLEKFKRVTDKANELAAPAPTLGNGGIIKSLFGGAIGTALQTAAAASGAMFDPSRMSPVDSRMLPLGGGILGGAEGLRGTLGKGYLNGLFPSDMPAPTDPAAKAQQAIEEIRDLATSTGLRVTVQAVNEE